MQLIPLLNRLHHNHFVEGASNKVQISRDSPLNKNLNNMSNSNKCKEK